MHKRLCKSESYGFLGYVEDPFFFELSCAPCRENLSGPCSGQLAKGPLGKERRREEVVGHLTRQEKL